MSLTVNIHGAEFAISSFALEKATVNSYAVAAKSLAEPAFDEFEIILSEPPKTNKIEIPFTMKDLVLFYQPPLTEEFPEEDCEIWTATHIKTKSGRQCSRPENVVGSYAAYHASKRNNQYTTGKAFHIYRPMVIDAAGKKAWAEFNRDANQTKQLVITLPQKFLDEAVYPVIVDPTIGYTTVGGSTSTWVAWRFIRVTLPEAGTFTKLTSYFVGSGQCDLGLYDDDGADGKPVTALASPSAKAIVVGWVDFDINYVASAGNFYIGQSFGDGGGIKYDSSGGYYYQQAPTGVELPSPAATTVGPDFEAISVYATYTTGATVQTVTDSLSLSDSALRHKALLLISDSAALAEAFSRGKAFTLIDSLNLAEIERTLKELLVHDASSLADAASTVSRILQVSESVSIVEVVQVGAGGVRKTRLFLILGDLALQLT